MLAEALLRPPEGFSNLFLTFFQKRCKLIFSYTFNMQKLFVMGESFSCTSFSETKSGKRGTHFGSGPSYELYLERFFCEQEPQKMQGGHDESLFGRELIFCRPVDFSSRKSSLKECFAPLGAVDGAPSTVGAKHSL